MTRELMAHADLEAQRLACLGRAGFNVMNLDEADIALDFFSDVPHRVHVPPLPDTRYPAGSGREPDLEALARAIYGEARFIATSKGRSAEMGLLAGLGLRDVSAVGHPLFWSLEHALEEYGIAYEVAPASANEPGTSHLDLAWLGKRLAAGGVELVYLETGTNQLGGVPMAYDHVATVRALCERHGARLLLDATRLLAGCHGQSTPLFDLAQAVTALADAYTVSCPKELLVSHGGLIAVRDLALQRRAFAHCRWHGTLLEPMDLRLELAAGMERVRAQPQLFGERAGQLRVLADSLQRANIPFLEPLGGHAVYLLCDAWVEPVSPARLRALEAWLYVLTGIRCIVNRFPHLGHWVMRLAVKIGHFDVQTLAAVGASFAVLQQRLHEMPLLREIAHEELRASRTRYAIASERS